MSAQTKDPYIMNNINTDHQMLDTALAYAARHHKGQFRKGSNRPYYLHVTEVCEIATSITLDENILTALVLHDVIEDTDADAEEVRRLFGPRVLEIILGDTEDKQPEKSKAESWKERKQQSLDKLKDTKDFGVKVLWLCDKLSNIRSIYEEYAIVGDEVFQKFHCKDPKEHKWYYETIVEYLSDMKKFGVYHEFKLLVNEVFKNY